LRKVPISRSEKEAIVQELKQKFENSNIAIFADYKGLNVAEATRLRRRLREAGCEFKVAKNTLTRLVVKQLNLDELSPYLEGAVGITFGKDPVAPAKVLNEFIKETKKMEIKVGVLDGKIIDVKGVKSLADLPSREVLLGRVLGGMQAPLYGFASVLQGTLCSFVYALEALRKQRAGEA